MCADGKTLLDTLETPVSSGSHNSLTAKADYSQARSKVLDKIHQVFDEHRHVEQHWRAGKLKLHQRLGLKLFQQDVKQVIDWLDSHGEAFLNKNTSIGKSLTRAKALQKSHEHFEIVAQNTITNADKLIEAAEELADTGECDPHEIYSESELLRQRMQTFLAHVESRRTLLSLAVVFYAHAKEVSNCRE